jgi:hypothetical protein
VKSTVLFCLLCFPVASAGQTATQPKGQIVLGRNIMNPLPVPSEAGMSMEETLVRNAYAKFAFAVDLDPITQLALQAQGMHTSGPQNSKVTFRLSDFTVGNISDINNRKVLDVISPPGSEVLQAQGHNYALGGGPNPIGWNTFQPRWIPGEEPEPEKTNWTVGHLHKMEWQDVKWQRYAVYTVLVSYGGKTEGPYRAMFSFGLDANGRNIVMSEDSNVDSTALATVLGVDLFPKAFVQTRMRSEEVVKTWLQEREDPTSTCSNDKVCCDLVQLQCSFSKDDIAAWIAKPLEFGR